MADIERAVKAAERAIEAAMNDPGFRTERSAAGLARAAVEAAAPILAEAARHHGDATAADGKPPLPSDEDEERVITTLVQTVTSDLDFPGWLAGILARTAARLGSTNALLESRPGSWEASHLRDLLAGTVGYDDAYLHTYHDDYGKDTSPGD